MTEHLDDALDGLDIAIIGMACRFPGAPDVATFWSNLRAGRCAVSMLDVDELAERGVDAELLADPSYVAAAYLLDDADAFDADFFGYPPRVAELMDPQHRVLLECAWAAVEDAGLEPDQYGGSVGVFAGAGHNTYLLSHVAAHPDVIASLGAKQVLIGNRPDFLSSRVSYQLGLQGPSITVQTACSTSLVAVHQACQALLSYHCDAALAGGVAVEPTRHDGYLYTDDGILSPDGLCRTFDERGQGTIGGDGVGVVVLKRLEDALSDGDLIRAVIKGSAVNNDGSRRVGFSAPSATTQAAVMETALATASVEPGSVRFVECHGTATNLGDPIELAALKQAYADPDGRSCALGAVKTNIGHLDAAAGVAGLIKAVLVLEHGVIPPTLHFERPNPRLGLDASRFEVPTEAIPWPEHDGPRRAGVSSFGLGGTNAHVVLEQAPAAMREPAAAAEHLVLLSARTEADLAAATTRLHEHLRATPDLRLDDVALTLQRGRRSFPHRRAFVALDVSDAIDVLDAPDGGRLLTGTPRATRRPVAFLLGGMGSQFPGMARGLAAAEPTFRESLERYASVARAHSDADVLGALLDGSPERPSMFVARAEHAIDRPSVCYPAVLAFELALADLWASWGVVPEALAGHSLGEYAAAAIAGVFSLEDTMRLVIARAALIEAQPEGSMVAVALGGDEVGEHLDDEVSIAASNDANTTVLSGTTSGVERTTVRLDEIGVVWRRLPSRYAFHSPLMDAVMEPYEQLVRSVARHEPSIPIVSNLTGTWLAGTEATDPAYWARHLRMPVRFADCVGALWSIPDVALVEVGVGQSLTSSALAHPAVASTDRLAIPSLPGAAVDGGDRAALLRAAARLWLGGHAGPFPGAGTSRRVPLPTYPFARRRYWLDRSDALTAAGGRVRRLGPERWLYSAGWRRSPDVAASSPTFAGTSWLVFLDDVGLGAGIAARLRDLGADVATVAAGRAWREVGSGAFEIDLASPDDHRRLAEALRAAGSLPDRLVHCWGVVSESPSVDAGRVLQLGFESLRRWAQATEPELLHLPHRWDVVVSESLSVLGDEPLCPAKATVQGFCKVVQQEYPAMTCVHRDVVLEGAAGVADLADHLVADLVAPADARTVALRGRHRWTPAFEHTTLAARREPVVRDGASYLITGGLGRIGLHVARSIAEQAQVTLVLVGRSARIDASTSSALHELESLGAKIVVEQADVADVDAMRRVVDEHGPFRGVVHCAGATGSVAHHAIADTGTEEIAPHFDAKLRGPEVLRLVLADAELDFALLCSSVAAILGGLGFAAYAAANAALDAFARRFHSPTQPWCAVDWEAWRLPTATGDDPTLGAAVEALALSPVEGKQLVDALLASEPVPQVVVSTGDFAERLRLWSVPTMDEHPVQQHPRPDLASQYVEPSAPSERLIAEVWQTILGIDRVGVHDSFFELGGNSLLGLQVVQRLRGELRLPVPLTSVYEGPTVRTLAKLVEELRRTS